MGGSSHSLPRFSWEFVRKDDWHEVYQNDQGDLAEKHLIENDPKLNEEQEMETYYYRYRSNKPIIKVYRADYDKADVCSNHRNITVFTQYIPFRLIDCSNLSHHQGLYVLSQALIGFYELYGRLGPFAVDDTLIGFNQSGKCKVWYNPEFAKNHFDKDTVILLSTRNPQEFDQRMDYRMESEMVQNIWDAVCKHALFRGDFMAEVNSTDPLTFKALKGLTDNNIRKCDYVPPTLRFEDRYGIISSSRAKISQSNVNNYNLGGRMRNNRTSLQSNNRVNNRSLVEQQRSTVNESEVRRQNNVQYRPINDGNRTSNDRTIIYENRTEGNTMNSYVANDNKNNYPSNENRSSYVVNDNRNNTLNKPNGYQSSLVHELDRGSGAYRVNDNNRTSNIEERNVQNALNRSNLQDNRQSEVRAETRYENNEERGQRENYNEAAMEKPSAEERNSTMNEAAMGLLNKKQSSTYSNKGYYENNNREMIVN